MTGRRNLNIENIRTLAAAGLTRPQVAQQLNLGYGTIVRYGLDHDIKFAHAGLKTAPTIRTRQMAALYKSGKTLQEIGDQYNITRERVRQIITKFHGMRRRDGGQCKIAKDKRANFEATRNARSLKRWGCNWDQYLKLRGLPVRRFNEQKRNAGVRDIGWELSFWQWWSIWQHSGKWSQRGRGQGYMMCRKGDVGPYAIDNVFIATGCENSSQGSKKSDLPIGVSQKSGRGSFIAHRCMNGKKIYLGAHPTPELAHAAYLSAGSVQ